MLELYYRFIFHLDILFFKFIIIFHTDCIVPLVINAVAKQNGLVVTSAAHETRVDYYCDDGYIPTTAQVVVCGTDTPGVIDVEEIECDLSLRF